MTAKEFLDQIKTLDTIIKQKRRELNTLHEIATAVRSFDYSGDKVQTSPKGEAPFAKTAERAAELDEEIRTLEDKRLGIIDTIYTLTDQRQIRVLYMRHVEGRSVRAIADILPCGTSTAYRLINDAYEKLGTNEKIDDV